MEHLFIVIYRGRYGAATWKPWPDGVFTDRRLAESLVEISKAQGNQFEFAVVEGSTLPVEHEALVAETF
jgi:hypothetical protein